MRQLISFVGALLILIAYVGHQMEWINARRPAYNILKIGRAQSESSHYSRSRMPSSA